MKRTLFYGYYGHQNTGDDAFVEVAAWGAKNYWKSTDNMFLTQNLPHIQNHGKNLGKCYFRGHYLLKYTRAIITADSFICAGGSTFHSQLSRLDPKHIARLVKTYSPKYGVGAIGVSLGPYKSVAAERDNIELLKRFDFLTLRDHTSYKISKTYNLPFEPIEAFDLAALLPEVYLSLPTDEIRNNKRIIGISICNYERYLSKGDLNNEERRNKKIEDLVIKLARHNENIVFRLFIFNGNNRIGDKEITIDLAQKLRSIRPGNVEVIEYDHETYRTWLKIKECNLVFATRLHAAIFACFAKIPFFLVEYHRKCSDFLNDIGYNDLYRIYDADFDINFIASLLIDILNNNHKFERPTRIRQAIEKSRFNFTKINAYGK